MTPLLKIGTGVLTIGTIAGAGYAGSTYFMNKEETAQKPQESKPTIRQLIEKDFDYILLNTEATGIDDSAHWKTNWENYKRDNNDVLQLEGWTTKRADADLTPALKARCKTLSTNNDDNILSNVTKYCGRAVTIADEAQKEKLTIISTGDATADSTTWQSKISKKQQLKTYLDKLSITDDNLNAATLKQKCSDLKGKKKQEDDYSNFYEAYKNLCTKLEG
ncbi:hypothetical protein A6V39_01285 [Candidatus Mycoplasma haematobovis]|uniref:Uncharacterized protein n=1 Tax=Candidatus Mycoplasma haematobovis TaxID=432608 RepID=A0A1A9QDY4_9MOLU|nr:hypothetical protein [Candidatus Mycoplasma haematobovis]OAL10687.1 hypothetical protein A6V39_01285 [Candidatus Mycoplasma haematobovis]